MLCLIPAEMSSHSCIHPVISWSQVLGKSAGVGSIAVSQITIHFWFLFWYVKLQRQLLFFCLHMKQQPVCHVTLGFPPFSVRKDSVFPSCLLPSSLQKQSAPIPYLAAGCGWGQNHQGWFCSLEFPQGYCVHLLRTAEEKGLFWQLLLFRANFKWWALYCKLSLMTLKWCAIICLLSNFSLRWLLPRVLCVTCIFGRVCAICCTLSFNFPWQIKSLLSHKCLC